MFENDDQTEPQATLLNNTRYSRSISTFRNIFQLQDNTVDFGQQSHFHAGRCLADRATPAPFGYRSLQAKCWLAVCLQSAVHCTVWSGCGKTTSTLLCFKTWGVWNRSTLSVNLYLPQAGEKKNIVVVQREYKWLKCTDPDQHIHSSAQIRHKWPQAALGLAQV